MGEGIPRGKAAVDARSTRGWLSLRARRHYLSLRRRWLLGKKPIVADGTHVDP